MQDDSAGAKADGGVKGAQTLMRALDILDEVIAGPVRAADLARKLDMSKTTTHRLAQALRSRDYLSATQEGFALGPKLLQLGAHASEQMDYARVARPYMEILSDRTDFCVFVGKREGDWSRHLDRVTGRQRLRVSTAPGDRRLIAETGLGKALLLDEDQDSLKRLYQLSQEQAVSPSDMNAWVAAMGEHARRGVVLHESALGDGVRSIAAPVRDAKGKICVAISIAGAALYLTDDVMRDLAEQVRQTAVSISAAIGYRTGR